MAEGKYKPFRDVDWYPAKISADRIKQLQDKNLTCYDFTCDDIVYTLGERARAMLHHLLLAVKQVADEETVIKVARRAGYNMGKANIGAWQKRFNTKQMSAEQWAIMQDFQHALGGFSHCHAFVTYDDKKCVIRRTNCGYLTHEPETMHLCKYMDEGIREAYQEMQPGFKVTMTQLLPEGGDFCEHIMEPPA